MTLPAPYYDEGGITIYNGEACDMLRQLEPGTVDALLTDPPYSSGGMFRGDRVATTSAKYVGWTKDGVQMGRKDLPNFGGDNRDQRGFFAWASLWSGLALQATRPTGMCFVFSDWRQLPTVTDAVQGGGWTWRGIVTWDKGHARPIKGRFRANTEFVVWGSRGAMPAHREDYPSAIVSVTPPRNKTHATQKPVEAIHHLLRVVPEGGTVLDPFMGSGSTLVAAQAAGHRAIGIEIEERYCEIAAGRLAQATLFAEAAA